MTGAEGTGSGSALAGPRFLPSAAVPGISDAVLVPSGSGLAFVSGQIAPAARSASFAEELDECFRGLDAVLARASLTPAALARLTLFVVDLPSRDLETIRAGRDRWVDTATPPASALIGVSALALPGLRSEVEAVAILPPAPAA
ncbi:hypothetical protein ATY41_03215 [Leifsonia xyli subsp. xyli]|uniref:Translational inhibitor protein n=2 Tax=Leifsonia xyli subsp. xyli TaxID=59736 RepID=Q6ACC7_LEIXX|nr:RidA family protein [Leifsonia xyli]AAT89966.1 translational inhibitor protein [Leifsonia xyli subsp. xyli str. CTCB07]ODA90052.1 hypothetical protein ATY41_03215 [Leifsonia xyli subsp. xyli]